MAESTSFGEMKCHSQQNKLPQSQKPLKQYNQHVSIDMKNTHNIAVLTDNHGHTNNVADMGVILIMNCR